MAMKQSQVTIKPSGNTTMKPAGSTSALKAAGTATLNPTVKLPPKGSGGGKDDDPVWIHINTVHDPPVRVGEQTRKLETLGGTVRRMDGAFQDATRMKQEKAQMMDEMHEHSLEKVEETRVEMDVILAELADHIKEFSAEWTVVLRESMDKMDVQLKERFMKIVSRFEQMEVRTAAVQVALDWERESRLRDTDAILTPVRKQLEVLQVAFDHERSVRENREKELRTFMDESVDMLEKAVAVESENRGIKHEEFSLECEKELVKLAARQERLKTLNETIGVDLQKDMDNEARLRNEGQDHIVTEITDFIKKFQMHVKEEGQMGN